MADDEEEVADDEEEAILEIEYEFVRYLKIKINVLKIYF